MDIEAAKKVLEVMKGLDISEAGIFAEGDENQIRGISSDNMNLVYASVPQFIETQVGVLSVKGLLSRLELFDSEKMGVSLSTNTSRDGVEYVDRITVKEGRRRTTVTTTNAAIMETIPSRYPAAADIVKVSVPIDYVAYLTKMKTSIGSAISGDDEMYIEISAIDGTSDTAAFSIGGGYDDFEDRLPAEFADTPEADGFVSVKWKIDPFLRAMKQAAAFNESTIEIAVNSLGLAEIDVDGLTVSVAAFSTTIQD